jgi:hypothetical protein
LRKPRGSSTAEDIEVTADDVVVVKYRFRGPPTSANGGYVCGVIARSLDGPVEVTLRRPPPLNVQMRLSHLLDGHASLDDGDGVIAEAVESQLELEIPPRPSILEVEQVAPILGPQDHPFPGCFVCGPERGTRDGLRIFAGLVIGKRLVAGTWRPDVSLLDDEAKWVRPEFVWAALDCPGGWALLAFGGLGTLLLGRFTARLLLPVSVGDRYIVIGWPIGGDGKREWAGSALFTETGDLVAYAKAIWFRR